MAPLPVWIYGINDHLDGPKALPADFQRGLTLREDYLKLCAVAGAVPHPGLKAKPKVAKINPKEALRLRQLAETQAVPAFGSRRGSIASSKKMADAAAAAADAAKMTEADEWGGRKSSIAENEPVKEEKPLEKEDPVLCVRSMLLDRITMHLLGLLLPTAQKIKVLVFSDCRLDVDMLRLLRDGLHTTCAVESLQIEWNPLEVPLPTVEELEADEAAKVAEAAAAAADGDGTSATAPGTTEAEYDLEFRERRRYRVQSQRTLQGFKDRLTDLFDGSLDAAFEALKAAGDADTLLNYCDFQAVMEVHLGISGLQVVGAFEVLDGPDYAGSEGLISLSSLRQALESLPEDKVREGTTDTVGAALAAFVDPGSVLESLSFRACSIGRVEMAVIGETLKQCPWNLRILNLWDNYLCDRAAVLLASAVEEYRGFEYIGLGRNRITDVGLAAVCNPFNWQVLDDAGLKTAQDHVKAQNLQVENVEKAKAKAKAKPAPAPGDPKEKREPPLYVDDLKESPAEEEGGESVWVFRRHTELKTLNVSENPIKDGKALEVLQILGPEVELVLRGCPVSGLMLKKPDIASKGRRASGIAGIGAMDGGWVLRMV